ncbi:MAG: MATE family efflux transporter [Clostridia bacterium]|nr:MATE family efflux transporter [Clostridia bacterium]
MPKPMTAREKHAMMVETPIRRLILRMAVPSIISMLVTSLYNMADTYFIGLLNNTSATGAISVVFPLMTIIQAVGFTLGHGSGNTLSRALGRQDGEDAARTAATGFFLAWIVGVVLAAAGLCFTTPLMRALGSTETILPYAVQYGRYILIGAPWMMASIVLNVQMRFQGNAFFSMIGIATGAVVNIALDPLFIFVFGMGVSGAAVATVCSQAISFGLLFSGTFRGGNIRIRFKDFKPEKARLKAIFLGGLPSLCRQSLGSVAGILMNVAARTYGGVTPEAIDAAVAAMGIVNRMMQLCASAIIGIGQGFQPVCGFNYGAKKLDRVRQGFFFTFRLMLGTMLVISALGLTVSPFVIGLFSRDQAVVDFGSLALRLQCAVFPLQAIVFATNMTMQTISLAVPASVLSMARNGIFFIPMILLLPPLLGALGVQSAQAASDALSFLLAVPLCLHMLRRLRREEAALAENGKESV